MHIQTYLRNYYFLNYISKLIYKINLLIYINVETYIFYSFKNSSKKVKISIFDCL